jgi:rhamnose transport system ATP-binding protein
MLLDAQGVTKAYAGVQALRHVSFDLEPGEVHALVGENGAGKSTLIKIMTGAVQPDSGTLSVSGERVSQMTPALSRALGIAAIYQQPTLFPDLTVAENIALTLERGGRWTRMPEQQIVEIAKAIGADAKVVIMDEPTAALTEREVDSLFAVVARLRSHGAGVIYISHRLDEVFALADRITVLRDGETIATRPTAALSRAGLIAMMIGRELSAVFPKRPVALGDVALEVRQLHNGAAGLRDISFSVRRGEILGIAGLVGSGRTQLAETLFGITPMDSGQIVRDGRPVTIDSPGTAIAAGIAYVPEDRRQHGVILDMSIVANASLANLPRVSPYGLIDRGAERTAARDHLNRLRIKAASIDSDVGTLSGGNQQKVALARWLSASPSVLILDEPTQGVDVGSKAEIHDLMQGLAERGLAIVMISSELPEILGMSDRVAVMHAGTIRAILGREDATPARVMALALAEDDEGPRAS